MAEMRPHGGARRWTTVGVAVAVQNSLDYRTEGALADVRLLERRRLLFATRERCRRIPSRPSQP